MIKRLSGKEERKHRKRARQQGSVAGSRLLHLSEAGVCALHVPVPPDRCLPLTAGGTVAETEGCC